MLDRYMRRVFGVHLEPKRIHGRQLTAPELMTYIKTYVALFQVRTTSQRVFFFGVEVEGISRKRRHLLVTLCLCFFFFVVKLVISFG
jgi:hypothetical protein